ncbi:MAG: protein kinase [Rhodothermales bacterium]|nr:protein kinase [Rhodothermales bacterium]
MDTIGKYSIQGILSQDDTGVMYHAVDTVLDRDVTLKVIHGHFVESKESRDAFFADARAAMHLTHENIAALYDVSEDDGRLYLVMEFLDGYNLTTVRDAGIRIPLVEKLRFARQIARGLAYAHKHGIVHGELRPETIVIVGDNELKIQDFVGAPVKAQDDETKSAAGTMVDMLQYLSPEHIRNVELDARSDIFSLGSIVYELVQGEPPFAAQRKSDVVDNILQKAPPDLDQEPGAGAMEAEQIIFNCLAKNPEDRYQSCKDLIRHLDALIDALAGEGPGLGSDRLQKVLAETADPDREVAAVSHVVLTPSGDFETRTVAYEVPKQSGSRRAESASEREFRLGYKMIAPGVDARRRARRKRRAMIGAGVLIPVLALFVWLIIPSGEASTEGNGAAPESVQQASTTTFATDLTIRLSASEDTLIGVAAGAGFGREDAPSLEIVNLPLLGTALVESDSLIRYTPSEGVSGDDEFGYVLSWPSGRVEQATVSVTIPATANSAPAFTSRPSDTNISSGGFFSYDIETDDPDGDDVTISSRRALPTWMRLIDRGNGSGSLRGTPTAGESGDFQIVLQVSDGTEAAEQRFTVNVEAARAAEPTPVVQPPAQTRGTSPANGAEGVDTTVPLSWTSVSGADLYRAQVSLNQAFSAIVADGSTSATTWTTTGLAEETTYYWRVRASRAGVPGAWSPVRSFTTRLAADAAVRDRIDAYVAQLRTAFDERDADALERVHPDYDDWYFQLFSASTQYDAFFDVSDIQLGDGRATARVTITVRYQGGEDVDTRIWTLAERGDAWQLVSMEKL